MDLPEAIQMDHAMVVATPPVRIIDIFQCIISVLFQERLAFVFAHQKVTLFRQEGLERHYPVAQIEVHRKGMQRIPFRILAPVGLNPPLGHEGSNLASHGFI